jgi:hypothetical protein
MLYSGGRNAPLNSLVTAGDCSGSSPSQSMHRNLRPPVLAIMKRIGLRHFGQGGGGRFLAMALTSSGESITELTVTDISRRSAMIAYCALLLTE